jgi:phenylacetate-CoA ligase
LSGDRELYNPTLQAADEQTRIAWIRDGFALEWQRVWDENVEFYRNKYSRLGFSRDEVPELEQVPRTVKDELRLDEKVNPPLGTHRAVRLTAARYLSTSGGTTGRPQLHFRSERDQLHWVESMRRHWWRCGLREGDRLAQTWPPPPYSPPWVLTLAPGGIFEIPTGPPTTHEAARSHIELWQDLQPTAFFISLAQLQFYERVAGDMGLDFRTITEGTTVSILEVGCQFDKIAQRVVKHYDFSRLHNLGGCGDIPSAVGSSCQHNSGIHMPSHNLIVEVVDPKTGRAVPAGERGQLVLTALDHDMIAIRFDLQDIVVRHDEPCACGETGPRFVYHGRTAEQKNFGSTSVLPIDVQLALIDEDCGEFLIDQNVNDVLKVTVESTARASDIETLLRGALDVPVSVETVEPGSLPVSTWKARRVG